MKRPEPDFETDLQIYEKLLEIDPNDAEAWKNKGEALRGLGRHEEALEAFEKALEIRPEYAEAWSNKGNALDNLGRQTEALEAYEKALEIRPEDSYAWNDKGDALGNLGRFEEALEAYEKALKINPDNVFAWKNKGNALNNLGRYEEALKAYEKELLNYRYSVNAWNGKGNALGNLGRFEEALEAYEKALKIDPHNVYAREGKGNALYRLGRYEKALKAQEKSREWKEAERKAREETGGSHVLEKLENTEIPKTPTSSLEVRKFMDSFEYDVFICHSSKDNPIIEVLIKDLKKEKITYWIDAEQIGYGDSITRQIEKGLQKSKYIIPCLSKNLNISGWTRTEYGSILNAECSGNSKRIVIPLMLDNCEEYDIPLLLRDKKRATYSDKTDFNEFISFLKKQKNKKT